MRLATTTWSILWASSGARAISAGDVLSPSIRSTSTPMSLFSDIDTEGDEALADWLKASSQSALLQACPEKCSEQQNNSTKASPRYLFSDEDVLSRCNETMLVDLVVKSNSTGIRACVGDYEESVQVAFKADADKAALCKTPNHNLTISNVSKFNGFPKGTQESTELTDNKSFTVDDAISALEQVSRHLDAKAPSCAVNSIEFGYSKSAVVGVFVGSEHRQHGLAKILLDGAIKELREKGTSKTTGFELCQGDLLGSDYLAGIIITHSSGLYKAKDVVATWASGTCFQSQDAWMDVTVRLPPAVQFQSNSTSNDTTNTSAMRGRNLGSWLSIRGKCKTTTVDSGSGCWAVAQKCGISLDDLETYNPQKNFCTTLVSEQKVCCSSGTLPSSIPPAGSDGLCKLKEVVAGDTCSALASKCGLSPQDFIKVNTKDGLCRTLAPGQNVCCSYGKLPDRRPKPNDDGTCASIKTKIGDDCFKIAAQTDLSKDDLEKFNKKTWGWKGCDLVFVDFQMCVSEGDPPMPAPVANAVCGPTVPGTSQPPKGSDLADTNPCPLKACCNVWGQCGLTDDFCIFSPSTSGAPGSSSLKNGCVSNCGRELKKGPEISKDKRMKVAYFEAWNGNRKCLHMDITDIDTSVYTHIHFAFAEVTSDYNVDISKVQAQFDKFKQMSGIKKIISFGGWDFSTLPGSFDILREAVKSANRDTFTQNVAKFVQTHNLDGVDIDWEYPGAPDIPGIPSDDPHNGANYYFFLRGLKATLGDKSVSFAAPSSYWYMKAYPISLMARVIDYIIFMTYDLHGQWDYNNKWTSPGCDTGNCLRSHVNDTETKDSLIMITKAGVSNNKVVVGVASYGRSFKMETAGCDSPICKFTGSPRVSNAAHGRCTDTGGYISNAEITEIIQTGHVNRQWQDAGSDIFVYNDTEWVAYMSDDTKSQRAKFYDSYNFLGTTDWAVDLQEFDHNGDGDPGNEPDDEGDDDLRGSADAYPECTATYDSIDSLENAQDNIPDHCVDLYATQVQQAMLADAMKRYDDLVDGDYDHYYDVYATYVKQQVPVQLEQFMSSKDAQQYFKCTETGLPVCCGTCRWNCSEDDITNCDNSSDCKANTVKTRDIDCPTEIEQRDYSKKYDTRLRNATFHLTDRDGFFKALSEKYGIDESWVGFGNRDMELSQGCKFGKEDILKCQAEQDSWYYDFPTPLTDKIKAFNPKDTIAKGYSNMTTTRDDLEILLYVSEWQLGAVWDDAADATDVPSMSVVAAIDSMKQIRDKGKDIAKKEREEFILDMVMGVLFFIPFVGEAASALAEVKLLCRLIGDTGNLGLAVYDIVKDPKDAFNAVFGALMGYVMDNVQLGKSAKAGRDLKASSLDDLKGIKDNVKRLSGSRQKCGCKGM